jgi:hypothetical protein
MKGLILKELYMVKSYCKLHLLLLLGFGVLGILDGENAFFLLYPAVMAGTIPMTLLAYDAQSGWQNYCQALPVTRRQQVTVKYLMGLMAVAVALVIDAVMLLGQGASAARFGAVLGAVLLAGCFGFSLTLPPVFRLGVEKGRMFYYLCIGGICGISFNLDLAGAPVLPGWLPWIAAPLMVVGSWLLSCKLFEKREL